MNQYKIDNGYKAMSAFINFFENMIRQNHNLKIMKLGEKIARNFLRSYWNEAYYNMQENGEF